MANKHYQGNDNIDEKCHCIPPGVAIIKQTPSDKCWQDVGDPRTVLVGM